MQAEQKSSERGYKANCFPSFNSVTVFFCGECVWKNAIDSKSVNPKQRPMTQVADCSTG